MTTYRYRGVGTGGFSMGFPPFTGAVKFLVLANAAIFLLRLLLGAAAPLVAAYIDAFGSLTPFLVVHGWIWQLVTYSFLHAGLFHILFNMLTLWMFGAQLEMDWGDKLFYEFYFFCVVGAALTTTAVAYFATIPTFQFLAITPGTPTVGASGGIFGLMIAFAMLHGDQEFMLFPIPILIRAKYLVAIFVFIALAGALSGPAGRGQAVAYFAHLGGALFGWFYIKYLPRRGLGFWSSEHYFGVRNAYYRWKRRRAAKKFQVYMRDFDEHGNYRGPAEHNKGDGETRPPWVN